MLYTGKGDKGDTGLFGCSQRISKSSQIAEALGTLDELNSFMGFSKTQNLTSVFKVNNDSFISIIDDVQQNVFILQAELAGTDKTIEEEKVHYLEELINKIEEDLPEINSFFVPGGTELSALLDVLRTQTRRAERRIVAAKEEGQISVGAHSLAYINRLSSLFYAMARLANHKSGIVEEQPHY